MTDDEIRASNEDAAPPADDGLPGQPPPAITHLARERAEARAARDWPRADSLKAEIEAAGWRVVDRGTRFTLRRAAPLNVEVDGETRYGSAASVPSRLAEPPSAPCTVVVLASEEPRRVHALLAGLRAHAPAGTHVVVVENDPSDAQVAELRPGSPDREPIAGGDVEVLRTSTRLGYAAALNVALRRAAGEIVVLADATAIPDGDALTPLTDALADPTVAVAGAFGLVSADRVRMRPAGVVETDARLVMALEHAWLGFRRSDYVALGPLDEHFVTPGWLDVWWSLRLRVGEDPNWDEAAPHEIDEDGPGDDEGNALTNEEPAQEPAAAGGEPGPAGDTDGEEPEDEFEAWLATQPPARSAVRLDLPLARETSAWPPIRTRLNRRNAYRVLDRYGWRSDVLSGNPWRAGEGDDRDDA